jgi:hypothetical protein
MLFGALVAVFILILLKKRTISVLVINVYFSRNNRKAEYFYIYKKKRLSAQKNLTLNTGGHNVQTFRNDHIYNTFN